MFLGLGLGACSQAPRGHDPLLALRLGPILQRHADTGARVSARVIDLESGRELYAINIDEQHLPASNMKLVTAATGLDTFGPDHVFETYLAYDGTDVWIVGTGDPAVGDGKIAQQYGGTTMTVLEEWAQALVDKGLTTVPGGIRYYAGALDNELVHESWGSDNLVFWYAAPVSGLNFNDNCVDITVYPTQDGDPAGYEMVPPVGTVTVVNECVSGRDADATVDRLAHADVLVLGGGCTKRKSLPSKPVTDPAGFFAEALRAQLLRSGIAVQGDVSSASEPLGGTIPPPAELIVATHRSAMRDVLWRILKSSQNLFAECLCKLNGQAYDAERGLHAPGSWASGERAARAFLRRHAIDDAVFVGADGSGLSRGNRVSVRLISDLLAAMHRHPYADAFRAALAEPGGEGTLRSRMKELQGQVFAKTGYIRGVRALSGYVHTRDGRWLCFSIIFNGIPGSVAPFNAIQDDVCRVLATWPDVDTERDPGE
jgi:D-alanyl-D-alanine carboxypeptidase/D-alanyl-D-alanine-endopeptidase (penicillin-binding protein 4)